MFFLCNLILLKINVNKFLKINYVSVQNAKKFYVTLCNRFLRYIIFIPFKITLIITKST